MLSTAVLLTHKDQDWRTEEEERKKALAASKLPKLDLAQCNTMPISATDWLTATG